MAISSLYNCFVSSLFIDMQILELGHEEGTKWFSYFIVLIFKMVSEMLCIVFFSIFLFQICAIHLLGYKYGCDAFPPASDVVKAPSICIPSAVKIVKPIGENREID